MHGDSTPSSDVPQSRVCSKCGEAKPPTEFYRDVRYAGGLRRDCKACSNARSADYRRRNGDALRAKDRARQSTPERLAQKRESNRRRVAKTVEYNRQWRARNLERARERERAYQRVWARANPEKVRVYAKPSVARYKARRRGAAGHFTRQQWEWRWNYYGGLCWMCGKEATTMDHVIAIKRGGTNWPANLRPACGSCNPRKKDQDWRQFVPMPTAGTLP